MQKCFEKEKDGSSVGRLSLPFRMRKILLERRIKRQVRIKENVSTFWRKERDKGSVSK